MKIALTNLQPDYGGAEVHVRTLARGLSAYGHDVRLFCHPDGRLRDYAHSDGTATQSLPARNQLDGIAALRLAAHLRRDRPDVLHLHASRDYLCGLLAGRLAHTRVVLTRHMLLPLRPAMRRAYTYADAVICLSQGLKTRLLAQGIPAHKLHLIYGAIDLTPFSVPPNSDKVSALRHEWGAQPREMLIGCIGRLVEGKGQATLLQALSLCREAAEPLRLVLVGNGPLQETLQVQAKTLGIADRVHFAGFRHDIPQVLATFDSVVVPSTIMELLPLALMEAMASGQPVLATRVEGITEIVDEERMGCLLPPGNATALAEALRFLASSAEARNQRGKAAKVQVESRFALPRMLEETQQLYERLDCSAHIPFLVPGSQQED